MLSVSLIAAATAISGCGSTADPGASFAKGTALQGKVIGGQQPVSGSVLQLYAAGSAGDASAASPLLKTAVTSDQNGGFSISNDYTCPVSNPEVYLVATGGNPGLTSGTNNKALTMMAALGPCNSLSSSTPVLLDEVTTVGSIAALHSFMASSSLLGSGASDAAQLTSAFSMVNEYTNIATGLAPGPALPTGYYASSSEINLLADALSSCINSTGGIAYDGSPCGNLFVLAKPVSGSAPTDVITAVVNILNQPTLNVSSIGALAPSFGAPFQPTNLPPDWTLPVVAIPATPTISPAAGSYYGAQTVILSEATPGVTVYYTLNGSAPTTASTPYTGPFTVSSSAVVQAVALSNRVVGSTNSAAYTILPGPASIISVTGSGQSATVNAVFNNPLQVQVLDGSSSPFAGAVVTFTVVSSGAGANLSATSCVTGTNGMCSVNATANGTEGTYSVLATVGGLNTSFTLNNKGLTGDLAQNLLADYNFYQQSGTVLTDISGHGNDGTLGTGANAPTWIANGLRFTGGAQSVALPSELNAAKTFVISLYVDPVESTVAIPGIPPSPVYSQFMPIISSSLGFAGFNIFDNGYGIGQTYGQLGTYAGNVYTQALNESTGFHTITVERGSGGGDLDQFFIDGYEVAYRGQLATPPQTSGNLFINNGPGTPLGDGMTATFYRMRVYSTKLNATNSTANTSDVVQLTQAFAADVAGRGVPVTTVPVSVGQPIMHGVGDSITYGAGSSNPGGSGSYLARMQPLLLNQPTYTVWNWGIPSVQLSTLVASEENRVARYCSPTPGGASVALVFAGTNDMGGGNSLAVYSQLKSEVHILKQAGCKVFVGTMLSRIALDSDKDAYNNEIRTGIVAEGADGILDFGAIPQVGADGANASTYFSNDHIHPVDPGHALLAAAAANTLNYFFGHHTSNPATITATTYQMTAADGYVNVQPTAATALTLPSCIGQSGASYTINNSQSTYAVTLINGDAAQTINGTDYTATGTFTVPPNGRVTLLDVPLSPATGGCVWQAH